ncbi:AAA family ATPase [Agarivorans sp. DSG3-1]|uniref:AAA family ATPase n=1 Tax=Agarivorans sp. DSG3-1 TaxID=3342249 RepID=UPI00398F753B
MLKSLRVRNFRSFSNAKENAFIDIKPLTVLLGKNSSGKSSFIRSFPLLRQSVETDTTGPILWYGAYVDLGAFSEVKNNDLDDEEIHFDFKLRLTLDDFSRYGTRYRRTFSRDMAVESDIDLDVSVSVGEENKKTVAKAVKITLEDEIFEFKFQNQEKGVFSFNGIEVGISHILGNQFIPHIGKFSQKKVYLSDGEETTIKQFDEEFLTDYLFRKSLPRLRDFFHSNTSVGKIREGLDKIGICNRESLYKLLHYVYSGNSVFIRNLEERGDEIVEVFFKTLIRFNIIDLLETINRDLSNVFKGVRYIAPLRATAERYYRHQDLQVNEIDHTGSNLAMLLKSLPETQKKSFSKWTEENFGFSIRVEELGLHYALKIKNKHDSHEYNINDMGFGFSQILPIVASIWFESQTGFSKRYRYRRRGQLIFTIEQPELHLHPEYQMRLAKLFAKVVTVKNRYNSSVSIIFETHSRTMINALGDCIEVGELSEHDVNIAIFDKGEHRKFSNVSFSKFDEDGDLINWPIGFFSGSVE